MNTKQLKSRSLLLLAVLLIASTAISWGAKPESIKKKEISKSFDVSLSDLLMTDNRYGNTTITHWNKNEVAIRVEIEAKAESADAAQACIDRVNIELKKSGNTVSAITSLKQQNWGNNNSNIRFTINYFISICFSSIDCKCPDYRTRQQIHRQLVYRTKNRYYNSCKPQRFLQECPPGFGN